MNDTAYWIWLLRTLGPAAVLEDIIQVFGSARGLYEAGRNEWRLSGLLSAKQMDALAKFSPSESGGVMKACVENGWQIVTPDSLEYPQRLRNLRNFPPILFVHGDAGVLREEVMLSIVGTRKASNYGLRVASLLSGALSRAGAVLVSGGALGIDSAAHMGALRAGGKTIAVLGCGLGTNYLRENAGMRAEIARSGAVISEFLPFSPASRTTFPLRNRIISGLSLGTVVVEAGEHSGSLITARCAMEQDRDVFAVPGDIISSAFTGANKLIHDGAKPVFTPLDILEEYVYTYQSKLKIDGAERTLGEMLRESGGLRGTSAAAKQAKPSDTQIPAPAPKATLPQTVSSKAQAVYNALVPGELHIDELSSRVQLPVGVCLAALTELELCGCAELTQGKKYRII